MLYIGSDHRGFQLKETLKEYLLKHGHEVEDVGDFEFNLEDDYVDFARLVAEKVVQDPVNNKGILLCGSGHGMDMVANKYKNLRAALGFNRQVAIQSREHEDANILVLPADWLKTPDAEDIVIAWLSANFGGEDRTIRRLQKMQEIEQQNFK